jgi:uncharacterized protein (TIGR02145 family)
MKQKNKIQLLLVAAFAGLSVMCYAQQAKMCKDTPGGYNIVSLQDPSDPSSYEWWEDGKPISGATAAVYTVPSDKAEGKYTYIRRSKKEGCDWASSNAYTVEVLTCGSITVGAPNGTKGTFKDERDQKVYKTVKMPDGKVWMAENLNYQSGLTFNQQVDQAKGQQYVSTENGVPAIGSFWCPAVSGATLSADKNTCNVYGALYTWETAMTPNGKLTEGQAWNESSVSGRYHDASTTPAASQSDPKVQGICPAGWHLPTDYEWANLLNTVDPACGSYTAIVGVGPIGTDVPPNGAAVQMKSASTYMGVDPGNGEWLNHDNRGTDVLGFGVLPAGRRHYNGASFALRGSGTRPWTSNAARSTEAWVWTFAATNASPLRECWLRSAGEAVRCLADN